MYKKEELKTLIPFDIETLPIKWSEQKIGLKKIWTEKYHNRFLLQELEYRKKMNSIPSSSITETSKIDLEPTIEEIYTKYAGLYAEFSRVWCISFGLFDNDLNLTVETLQEENEKDLLLQWCTVLEHYSDHNLAGHNISEFDIPFILQRMLVNGINETYPPQLQLKDSKPWTVKHVDFMSDWKNQKRENVSLALICELLDVPSPKDKFNNDEFTTLMTKNEITKEEGIEYCEKDVIALANCMIKCSSNNCNFGGETKIKKWEKKK